MKTHLFNTKGLTLIEVTVALGIMTISALAILQLMKIVDDKMLVTKNKTELQTLQQTLMPIINDPLNCGCQFKDLKIDVSDKTQVITLDKLNFNCGTNPLTFITTDPNAKTGTAVESIYVNNIKSTGVEGEFLAQVNIKPHNKKQSTVLKDASGQIKLYTRTTKDSPKTAVVVGCGLEPPPCKLPWGGTLAHREKVIAFKSDEIGNCEENSEERYCEFGTLKGNFTNKNCQSTDCITPWGKRIATDTKIKAYGKDLAASCTAEESERVCQKGVLTNIGNYPNCREPKCAGLDGLQMYQGETVLTYKSEMSDNCQVNSETRICNDGILSGSYTHLVCFPDHCTLPWGGIISDESSVIAYSNDIANLCDEVKSQRICKKGVLSGGAEFKHKNCESVSCKTPWGEQVAHDSFVWAYSTSKSKDCSDPQLVERRNCFRGRLSGSFGHRYCKEINCLSPSGTIMKDGDRVEAYRDSNSTDCIKEMRTCSDGVLSGSYQNPTCRLITCPSPFGVNLNEGETIFAYKDSKSNFCFSEIRRCSNGNLSGSFTHKTCIKTPNR